MLIKFELPSKLWPYFLSWQVKLTHDAPLVHKSFCFHTSYMWIAGYETKGINFHHLVKLKILLTFVWHMLSRDALHLSASLHTPHSGGSAMWGYFVHPYIHHTKNFCTLQYCKQYPAPREYHCACDEVLWKGNLLAFSN